ncbi:MAG: glycosyltransferase [Psychroflexus halocasei]
MKKALIITYYWPPAGGPGVQRWLKFSKYLPEYGIEPVVFKPKNPSYPTSDRSLLNEIPYDLEIIEKSIFEPYALAQLFSKKDTKSLSKGIIKSKEKQSRLQRLMLYIRGNFFIPDARKFWIKPSVKTISKIIDSKEIDCVITTGPPHSLHLIGHKLKIKFPQLHWITDFRDPWTNIGYHKDLKLSESSAQKHLDLEKEILNSADDILVTSFETKNEFEIKTSKPIHLITNGFDEADPVEVELDENFTLSHIGSLMSQRNPEILWQALSELIQEVEHFKSFFELRLVGNVSEQIIDSIYKNGLKEYLNLTGYVDHQTALNFQHSSQVLLLIEINSEETRGIIPGKVFEYLRTGRPILAIGPENWDVENIIEETQTGKCFNYEEKQDLKTSIHQCFKSFLNGKLKVQPNNISQYSRQSLTKKLSEVILK